MNDNVIEQMLSESAAEVLETMFFTSPYETHWQCKRIVTSAVRSQLSFQGKLLGSFGLGSSVETACRFAASFLGEDESAVSGHQGEEVLCELTNMLCGSLLSRLEKNSHFDLSSPIIISPEAPNPAQITSCLTFELEEGFLEAWVAIEAIP